MKKLIGILGGMGPQATSQLYDLIIKKSISDYNISKNQDFPEVIIYSIPIPDVILNVDTLNIAKQMLIKRTISLNHLWRRSNLYCL